MLALQGKPEAALEVYREVTPRLDPDFAYLATLFEGDAHQQLEDFEAAAASYAAARALRPGALSGVIAAASLAHAAGRRTEALQAMGLLNDTRSLGTSPEPWVWRATGGDPLGVVPTRNRLAVPSVSGKAAGGGPAEVTQNAGRGATGSKTSEE